MSETFELIEKLVAEARPVRRLRPPLTRSAVWLAVVGMIFALIWLLHGTRPDLAERLRSPQYAAEFVASLATGLLAVTGCFLGGLPDRSRRWLLLPIPALLVWLAAVGHSCITNWIAIGPNGVQLGEVAHCFATLLTVSLPLSALTFLMLRHVVRLRPAPVTLTGGLAVAATASAALLLFHALDATIMVLIWNLGPAVLITGIEWAVGARMLAGITRAESQAP